jgi:dTDP-4-dehydrorhamnose reductase
MRVIVIGKFGQLSRCLAECVPAGATLTCLGRRECDIANPSPDFGALELYRPHIVVNTAAYTAVDEAESDREAAFALNAHGPGRLATFAAARGIPLIHVSTDYVFDGTASRPYVETDAPVPLNVYGESKLEGERAVAHAQPQNLILRTSWLFSAHGSNFVKTMLRLAGERDRLRIVADQFGCPTSAHELGKCIWQLARRINDAVGTFGHWGIYHYAGSGATNWADFANAIFASPHAKAAGVPIIERVTTDEYPTPAIRPRYSVLNCMKIQTLLDIHPRPWKATLKEVLVRSREGVRA